MDKLGTIYGQIGDYIWTNWGLYMDKLGTIYGQIGDYTWTDNFIAVHVFYMYNVIVL